jgi:hypothetical protein
VAAGDIPTGWLSTDTKAPGGVVRMVRRRRRHPEVATIRNKTRVNLPMKVAGRDHGDRLFSSETCIKSSHAVQWSESHINC